MTEKFIFETELEVRMADINPAHHVGNDTFISFLQEARVQFFEFLGFPMVGQDKKGFIIADLAVSYKSQAFYKNRLKFEVGAGEFNKHGCDIFYKVTNIKTGDPVILAKTGVVFFDYVKNEVVDIPEKFVSHFR
ncbi:MAG: acyl-CoA thioesterase [Desulfobacteraceae bacterium]|nr:acyl-CoA thioesterase [Desulfobacteraceae bacterium]